MSTRASRQSELREPMPAEPLTYVPTADLQPLVRRHTDLAGRMMDFATRVMRFDPGQYSCADHASKALRRVLACDRILTSIARADAICLAAGENLTQLAIPVLPGGPTSAELMIHVAADLRGEPLTVDERRARAASLVNFATGYAHAVAGREDELLTELNEAETVGERAA